MGLDHVCVSSYSSTSGRGKDSKYWVASAGPRLAIGRLGVQPAFRPQFNELFKVEFPEYMQKITKCKKSSLSLRWTEATKGECN